MNLVSKSIFIVVLLLLIPIGQNTHSTAKRAVDFSLENFNGKTITLQRLKGKVVVLTFSYAFCSVRCPIISGRLSSLDDLMNSHQDVVYLHVSVDPEMDTPGNRKKYFKLYGIDAEADSRWMFVSGPKNELSKLWEFYEIDIKKIKNKHIPEGYYMEYTPRLVIIDKNGFIEHHTDFFFSEAEIAKIIGTIR